MAGEAVSSDFSPYLGALYSLNDGGDAHAAADAQRHQTRGQVASLQLIQDKGFTHEAGFLEQQKQKNRHDLHLGKEIQYKIGDKVLYFNVAQEKTWSGKLEQKWKGPFIIRKIIGNGAYKLSDENGKKIKTPINGAYLKHYKSRVNWDPIIRID